MHDLIKIHTPRGEKRSQGGTTVQVEWGNQFGAEWTARFQRAQTILDNEILRMTAPYVPHDTGILEGSAITASNIGGGELVWATPYAAPQYYNTADSRGYDHLRGGHWAERSKADNMAHFETVARKAVSG